METTQVAKKAATVIDYFKRDDVKKKFSEILGKRGNAFTSSVLTLINQSEKLKKCKPESVYMCAMMAATLDLPINSNLGAAYIVPYGDIAQFQIGYKGLIQLALRSGQFKTIDARLIYEGQLVDDDNVFGGKKIVWSAKASEKVIGYAAYFSLINGFEKTSWMTMDEVMAHGKRFSKTYNSGPWKTDFDKMALKTVLKLLIGTFAPQSVEMQNAIIADQAEVKDVDTLDVNYVDEGNAKVTIDELKELYTNNGFKLSEDEKRHIERIIEKNEEASFTKAKELLTRE